MIVAIVGGTGNFGRALARRLHQLGDDVLIGSREAQRAKERALEIGVQGDSNEEVVRHADLIVLATRSNAALETGAALADAIGMTPVLSVASDLRFTDIGIVPGLEEGSLAENLAKLLRAPVASGLQIGLRDRPLGPGTARPGRPHLRGRPQGEGARAGACRPAGRRAGGRRRPAGQLARARGDDGGDPEREQGVRRPRRAAADRPAVTVTIDPVEGLPEIGEGDDIARPDGRADGAARRRRPRGRPESGLEGRGTNRAPGRDRALRRGAASWPASTTRASSR